MRLFFSLFFVTEEQHQFAQRTQQPTGANERREVEECRPNVEQQQEAAKQIKVFKKKITSC